MREVEPDRFCSAVNRTEDWNGFIDGTGILHFQFQFIKNIHENLLRIASTTKIARAAQDDKSEVKSMKKRRDLFDKLSGVSDEELEDKDYKRYKRSYYCYILVSSVVALLLGLLYGRLMETLALLQRFLS